LDPLEERILHLIARSTLEQARLSVRDMMSKGELGAPATIHSRLKSMREKGWIVLAATEDARRKQIELSQAAMKYLARLSGAMQRAAAAVA
jgi:SOS-response transcriptional repressor LexA